MKIPIAASARTSELNVTVTSDGCVLFSVLLLNCFQVDFKAKLQLNKQNQSRKRSCAGTVLKSWIVAALCCAVPFMFGNCISFCLRRVSCVTAATVLWWVRSAPLAFVLPCFSFLTLVCLLQAHVQSQWTQVGIVVLQFISFLILGELLKLSEPLWVRSTLELS